MQSISRRQLLAAAATASAVALSGCFGGDGAMLSGESDCFDSVSFEASGVPMLSGHELTVRLREDCDAEYVVVVGGGEQLDARAVATAETKFELDVGTWTSDVELLAVDGGRIDDSEHIGGEIFERVAVEVNV